MCPPAEDESPSPASPQLQQPGASAELVDRYQFHITGDAMDALPSPVCASAQIFCLNLQICCAQGVMYSVQFSDSGNAVSFWHRVD